MKRLKKENAEIRDHVIPTTPLYNPLGEGNTIEDEFSESDKKSYQNMLNTEHKKVWTNDK